jgi:hypothetical protein
MSNIIDYNIFEYGYLIENGFNNAYEYEGDEPEKINYREICQDPL